MDMNTIELQIEHVVDSILSDYSLGRDVYRACRKAAALRLHQTARDSSAAPPRVQRRRPVL